MELGNEDGSQAGRDLRTELDKAVCDQSAENGGP